MTKPELSGHPGPILISACLAGRACRYDCGSSPQDAIASLRREGLAVLVCPEEDGGLPTPRPPAEMVGGTGEDVLEGRARVIDSRGVDVTEQYLSGAERALQAARQAGATRAILKARSPSCGLGEVYDGTFTRTLVAGDGVTAALLKRAGIEVSTDEDIPSPPTQKISGD